MLALKGIYTKRGKAPEIVHDKETVGILPGYPEILIQLIVIK